MFWSFQPLPRFLGRFALLLFLLPTLAACGGDDSEDSGSGGDAGVFGDIVQPVIEAEDDYIDGNAAVLASLDYFSPQIAATLSAPAPLTIRPESAGLLPGVAGQVFDYNGSAYIGVPDAGVPANGARFRLYPLGAGGTPNLVQPSGYFQITCSENQNGVSETIQVVLGSVTVLSLVGNNSDGGVFDVSGFLTDASGSPMMPLVGVDTGLGMTIAFIAGTVSASYVETPGSGEGPYASVSVTGPHPNALWQLYALVSYDGSEDVTGGYLSYNSQSTSGVVACATAGTLAHPVFSAPAAACAQESPLLSTTTAERQAMMEGWKALRSLWLTVMSTLEIGAPVVGAP